MKRFWLVLLSLGLVMAFSVSALAVDVKVSGEYYAAGLYLNKVDFSRDRVITIIAQHSLLLSETARWYGFYRISLPETGNPF